MDAKLDALNRMGEIIDVMNFCCGHYMVVEGEKSCCTICKKKIVRKSK